MAALPQETLSPHPQTNCWKCRHFGLTYRPSMPYRCDLLGFVSRQLPARDVLYIDGKPCLGFQPR